MLLVLFPPTLAVWILVGWRYILQGNRGPRAMQELEGALQIGEQSCPKDTETLGLRLAVSGSQEGIMCGSS